MSNRILREELKQLEETVGEYVDISNGNVKKIEKIVLEFNERVNAILEYLKCEVVVDKSVETTINDSFVRGEIKEDKIIYKTKLKKICPKQQNKQ